MKLYQRKEIRDVVEILQNLLRAEDQEFGKEITTVATSYSTAQADWDDIMRGMPKARKDLSIFRMLCEKCGQTINGSHLDHNIYRFKCMDCGTQWHAKREVKS